MSSGNDPVVEYPGDQAPTGPVASAGDVIEYDPDAPPPGPMVAVAAAARDTLVPSDDFFRARDVLQARLATFNAVIRTAATSDSQHGGLDNVVGVGVGFRYAADALTGEIAVKVFVREKLPMAKVASSVQIPPQIDGIPTDVEPTGDVLPQSYAKRYPRPVPCGVSCSHVNLPGSGTLGSLVVLRNRKLCLLSNNHVIANENAANVGDRIIQPGVGERVQAPDEVIGVLERFIPIQAAGNLVDAAVAWTSFRHVKADHVTYRVNPNPVAPALGLTVMKNGRTTQSTLGVVTDLGVNILVPYTPVPQGAEMRDQIAIRGVSGPFSKPGDSGSLIVTTSGKQPVALLFAGANDNSVTFANPIGNVMAALEIDRFV